MPLSIQDINADLEFLRRYYGTKITSSSNTYFPNNTTSNSYYKDFYDNFWEIEERVRKEEERVNSIVLEPGMYKSKSNRLMGYPPNSMLFIVRSPFSLSNQNWYSVEFFSEWGDLLPHTSEREKAFMRFFLKSVYSQSKLANYQIEAAPDLREML